MLFRSVYAAASRLHAFTQQISKNVFPPHSFLRVRFPLGRKHLRRFHWFTHVFQRLVWNGFKKCRCRQNCTCIFCVVLRKLIRYCFHVCRMCLSCTGKHGIINLTDAFNAVQAGIVRPDSFRMPVCTVVEKLKVY